jgi:D-glycero-D-manno-heptose 1,7-bisphosphate phosphatase
MTTVRKAAFLDRDGVINRDRGYIFRARDFELLPGAVEGLRELSRKGYELAVVSNQSGIARGYFTAADHEALTLHMTSELARQGVVLAATAHCPHLPDAAVAAYRCVCACRKPAPGMVLDLLARLRVDAAASILVGDKGTDIQAGRAAGVGRCYLVRSGQPLSASDMQIADAVFDDLAACASALPAGA